MSSKSFRGERALAVAALPDHHKDPFDRILVRYILFDPSDRQDRSAHAGSAEPHT